MTQEVIEGGGSDARISFGDGPCGVRGVARVDDPSESFPAPIAMAATFDTNLIFKVGQAIQYLSIAFDDI